MIIFFIICMLSVMYAAEIYQWQHYSGYNFKYWLKKEKGKRKKEKGKRKKEKGKRKKDYEEERIKKEAKKMTIDNILRALRKHKIYFDANELVKGNFNIKLKYYKLILVEKERLEKTKD